MHIIQVGLGCLMVISNILMLQTFNKALQISSTTIQVSIINTASNFIFTVIFNNLGNNNASFQILDLPICTLYNALSKSLNHITDIFYWNYQKRGLVFKKNSIKNPKSSCKYLAFFYTELLTRKVLHFFSWLKLMKIFTIQLYESKSQRTLFKCLK